jgi:hypothetical protein
MKRHLAGLAAVLALSGPALANDSTAELGTGGIILGRTDAIQMQKEDLFISLDKVTVDYVFHNATDADVSTIVAFPMPEISGNPNEWPAVPNDPSDNFLGFEVMFDGKPVKPSLEQRAFAVGVDVTAELMAQGIPLYPSGDNVVAALAKLPEGVAHDWVDRGIIVPDEYDDGSGFKKVYSPFWALKSTYWWNATFPANADVKVSHRYKPSVGGTAGLTFFTEGKIGGEGLDDYKQKYCMDSGFLNAVTKAAKAAPDGYPRLMENRVSYVLTTGGNWALGSIGQFKLTIDKGTPDALVSFCGDNVRKTGPTTFEMTATDFYPGRDIDILILKPWDWDDPSAEEPTSNDAGGQPIKPGAAEPDGN